MKIAIVGAGGVGGYLGAKLCHQGHDVTLVARGDHLTAIRKQGLRLESVDGDLHVQPPADRKLPAGSSFDLFIVAVKSFDTESAAAIIRPAMKTGSAVLTIQNGTENEDILGRTLGPGNIIGGIAWIFSTIGEPGTIRHTGGTGKFVIGELDGTISPRIQQIESAMRTARITIAVTDDIRRMLWEKWIFISAVGGMTASARKTIGEIRSDTVLANDLEAIVGEAVQVAQKKTGEDFSLTFSRTMARIQRLPPSGTSSMHYDITHGKRTEADALNGLAVRLGRELGLPVPVNERIYQTLLTAG